MLPVIFDNGKLWKSIFKHAKWKYPDENDSVLVHFIVYSIIDEVYKIIDKDFIKSCLWTKDLPLVDLVIRTGGEPHLSAGFMMWDIADAQFYFTEKLWPDFGQEDLKEAVKNYSQRPRRFGY